MGEYRNRTTGEIKTQGAWRSDFPNTSLPRTWTAATLDALNLDPVLAAPKPSLGAYQVAVRNGAVQDGSNWVEAWQVQDMFTSDADGTKAEKEAAYQAELDAEKAASYRSRRDALLAETDWTAMSDVTMSAAMTTYRQALRDLPTHANWPNLGDDDWPTKP